MIFAICLLVSQAHVLPRAAAVGGLVDAVAPRRALAVVAFTGADPHQVGVGRRNRDGADRAAALVVEHRCERRAGVGGLVDARRGHRDVERRRIAFEHGEIVDAARRRGRADRPEPQAIERPGAGRLLGEDRRRRRRRLGEQRGWSTSARASVGREQSVDSSFIPDPSALIPGPRCPDGLSACYGFAFVTSS